MWQVCSFYSSSSGRYSGSHSTRKSNPPSSFSPISCPARPPSPAPGQGTSAGGWGPPIRCAFEQAHPGPVPVQALRQDLAELGFVDSMGLPYMPRSDYVALSHGLTIMTPVEAKSETLRVIRCKPWLSAVAAISPSTAGSVTPFLRDLAATSPHI